MCELCNFLKSYVIHRPNQVTKFGAVKKPFLVMAENRNQKTLM